MSLEQLERVRRICMALPGASERLSHGEPTFFVHKRVFAMFANDHHHDGRIAVWLPAPPGSQVGLIASTYNLVAAEYNARGADTLAQWSPDLLARVNAQPVK